MTKQEAEAVADEIILLYTHHGGSEYAGEKVSQLEHMVQAAALAEKNGSGEEVILSAFLHDIGHLTEEANGENEMDDFGIRDHESIGAFYLLNKGFSLKICQLVASHVAAKRYLTQADPEYYEKLSDASKKTLEFQGGKMSAEEAREFQMDPLFPEIILLRKWDEQAKLQNQPMPDLNKFKNMIVHQLVS